MSALAPYRYSSSSVFFHTLNLGAALATIFVAAFIIPRFASIFDDMLGGRPLPPITEFVLHFRVMVLLQGCTFALVTIYQAWRYRLGFASPLFSVGLLLLQVAQGGFIILALFLPLVGTIKQVSPAP